MSHLKTSLIAAILLLFQSFAMGQGAHPKDFLEGGHEDYRATITMVDRSQFTGVVVEVGHQGWALIAFESRSRPVSEDTTRMRFVRGNGKTWIQTSHILTIDFQPATEPKPEEAKEEKAAE